MALYWLNDYIGIIETKELTIAICVILICLVLLKDTIYKCLDRICKKDETIEREKTKRILSNKDNDPSPDNKPSLNESTNGKDNDKDIKIYKIGKKPS